MSDELKNFQIKDRVPKGRDASGSLTDEPIPSAGFPHIEALLEAGDYDLEQLDRQIGALQNLAGAGAAARDRGQANKAVRSYQRTRELLAHLMGVRNQMLDGLAAEAEAKNSAGGAS
jgi:hypothetical protein